MIDSTTTAPTEQKRPREYLKSGFYKRKRKVKQRGLDGIDARTVEGRDALRFRDKSLEGLGGDITEMKRGYLDIVVGERYLWRSGWAFIIEQGDGVINKRRRGFIPMVKDVIKIGESLGKHLETLGLEPVPKRVQTLAEIFAEEAEAAESAAPAAPVDRGDANSNGEGVQPQ